MLQAITVALYNDKYTNIGTKVSTPNGSPICATGSKCATPIEGELLAILLEHFILMSCGFIYLKMVCFVFQDKKKAKIQGIYTAKNSIVFTIDQMKKTVFVNADGEGKCMVR